MLKIEYLRNEFIAIKSSPGRAFAKSNSSSRMMKSLTPGRRAAIYSRAFAGNARSRGFRTAASAQIRDVYNDYLHRLIGCTFLPVMIESLEILTLTSLAVDFMKVLYGFFIICFWKRFELHTKFNDYCHFISSCFDFPLKSYNYPDIKSLLSPRTIYISIYRTCFIRVLF